MCKEHDNGDGDDDGDNECDNDSAAAQDFDGSICRVLI